MSGTPISHMIIAGIGFSSGYAYMIPLARLQQHGSAAARYKGDSNFTANGRDD